MVRIEDFFPEYPQVDDRKFYEDIYKKKEFNQLMLDKYEKKIDKLLKHQQFISRFLSSHTPYTGLLLYHEMGSGKTCSSVAAAELIKNTSDKFVRAIYIARGRTLINKFIKEVACICTEGNYIPEGEDCKDAKFGLKRDKITRKVKEYYKFFTYDELKKELKINYNGMVRLFSNSVIIIDEIQNIRHKNIFEAQEDEIPTKTDFEEDYKNFYSDLHRLFHQIINFKLLLLSGTPMRDLPQEIVDILNLLLPMDKQITVEKNFIEEYFIPLEKIELKKTGTMILKYNFKDDKKEEFKNKIRGYVSFLKKMINPNINIIEEGKHVKDIKNLKVTPVLMKTKTKQTIQNVAYVKALEKDLDSHALSSNQMQASLFAWRVKDEDGNKYIWGKDLNNVVMNFDNTFRKSKLTSEFKTEFSGAKKTGQKLSKLAQFSRIYATVIANILKNRKQLHYVFINLVSGSGAKLFSQILNFFNINNVPLIDNNAIDLFNDREYQLKNNPVAIGIPRITEGINLENVQYIHILTPSRHFNNSETLQAISRAIRFGSHKNLLKESEKSIPVKIYKYMSIMVNSKDLEPIYDLSINYDQYLRSEVKDYNIKQIDRLLMESAVDCQINYKRNVQSDIDYSRDCEYNKCEYKCEGIYNLDPELDYSTYDLYYTNTKNIIDEIQKIFRIKFIYTYKQIENLLSRYNDFQILETLSNIINNRTIIYNKWGIKSFLQNSNNLYYLYSNINSNNLYMNYYSKNPSTNLKIETSRLNRIILDNKLSSYINNLNNICQKNVQVCGKLFDRLPLDIRQQLIENAIISMDKDKNKPFKKWIIEYNKNSIINLNNTIYLTLDSNNMKVLQGKKWLITRDDIFPSEEIFNKYIKNNELKFYGILENKEGKEIFKIRDISKPEYYMYFKDKGNLIRKGKKCESYDIKDLNKFKKKLKLNLSVNCNEIKDKLMDLKLILNNQQHISLIKYCKKISKKRPLEESNNYLTIINLLLKVKNDTMKKKNININELREALQKPLKSGQQDTHEYCLDLVLDNIDKYVKTLNKTKRTAYSKILSITTSSIINWEDSEKIKTTESTSISLPITPNPCKDLDEENCNSPCRFEKECKQTLQGLFEKYEEVEELKGENQYETDSGDKVDATKQLKITKWPNFLIVILKRFAYNFEKEGSFKVNDKILCVDENLKFSYNKQHYELISMNSHLGGFGGGHYIAYSNIAKNWYKTDDNGVEKVNKEEVKEQSENAYILIFKKTRAKNSPVLEYKPSGIDNDGNTCYFNSCIQTLMTIEPLWKFFQNLKKKSKNKKTK